MTQKTPDGNRIDVLDSFRFIAIFSVVLYHYYTRWGTNHYVRNLYPYEGTEDFFSYGYLGVEFFFIISGFVIAYTLKNTTSFFDFWKKRFIRLFPAMLFCSFVTYFLFLIFDTEPILPNSHELKNVGYSLTFLNPLVLDRILKFANIEGNYVNGSYWSLWPEIQFYVLASAIYFTNKTKFFNRFTWICIIIYLLNRLMLDVKGQNFFNLPHNIYLEKSYDYWITHLFYFPTTLLWFLAGVLFYQIFSRTHTWLTMLALCFTVSFLIVDAWYSLRMQMLIVLMMASFLTFIYYPEKLRFLKSKVLTSIGVASYSLYLIHENLGVLFIHKFGSFFGTLSPLFPVVIIILFVSFSLWIYNYIEKPLGKWLRKQLIK
ncbi:hypothetical protein CNR22_15285 [Sphingobacteriaceae bacterium]|nr:hypothetical protein CNR22_15285 [Sphingobacteriaceae bacterium]